MARKPALLALALATALASHAHATLMRAMPFDDKVEHAASIILGKCVATHSQWDSEHRWILTYSTFQVEQSMKGAAPQEITIVTPGGSVDGIHQDTVGVPHFQQGDENVVFTKATDLGPTVLYFDQGTYDIYADRGEKMVAPRLTGAVLVDSQRGAAVEQERPRALHEFQRAVRESMERTRTEQMEMLRAREKRQASLSSTFDRYKVLIILGLLGALVATIQLLRK